MAARLARTRVAPSRWLASALAERFGLEPSTLRVIPSGVKEDWFKSRPAPESAARPVRRIALVNMKGVDIALRALALVMALLDPAARLELYGVDRKSEQHAALARELGVARRIRFQGFVPHAEMPGRIAGADIVLHPSRGESFGQVLAEAAALGIPVISSRTHAIPEVVSDGETGLLCPVDDVEAYAQALTRLIAQPELRHRLGDAARKRAEVAWRWERIAARIEDEVYAPAIRAARRA
jgi:glycosyltransferase involved in cell wall biosynthesis